MPASIMSVPWDQPFGTINMSPLCVTSSSGVPESKVVERGNISVVENAENVVVRPASTYLYLQMVTVAKKGSILSTI